MNLKALLFATVMLASMSFGCDPRPDDAPLDSPLLDPTPAPTPTAPVDVNTDRPPAAPAAVVANESGLIPAAERREVFLDLRFTDQDGREGNLEEYLGKPLVLSFIFTRCPRPDMCPRIVNVMAHLQKSADEAGLGDNVRFALISYDPAYDTPERLKRYTEGRGLRYTNAAVLRPHLQDMSSLLHEMNIAIAPAPDGTIGHAIELMILDHQGREAYWRRDTLWDNQAVLAHLRHLVAEMPTEAG